MSKCKCGENNEENFYKSNKTRCKICGNFYEKLNVDHCHDTDKIRGLLCLDCNTGLGRFKDSSGLLGRAILYLKDTNTDKTYKYINNEQKIEN